MKDEIWRPVKGYTRLYEISSQGRVRSLPRDVISGRGRGCLHHFPQRVLKPEMDKWGYLRVCLYKDGKGKHYKVHRLVAEAFLVNAEGLPQVNHRDENKQNNAVTNLEWCDRKYNCNYGTRNTKLAAAKNKPVEQRTKDGRLITVWPSSMEAWRQTGIHYGNISRCCNGERHTAGRFVWRYTE